VLLPDLALRGRPLPTAQPGLSRNRRSNPFLTDDELSEILILSFAAGVAQAALIASAGFVSKSLCARSCKSR
jgi:hypothetical protein